MHWEENIEYGNALQAASLSDDEALVSMLLEKGA